MSEVTTTKPSVEEFTESLTGWDEIAIEKAFKIDSWGKLSPTRIVRALAFVLFRRRENDKDADAYERVMSMPMGEINDLFDMDDDGDADDPVTEPGKGDTPPE